MAAASVNAAKGCMDRNKPTSFVVDFNGDQSESAKISVAQRKLAKIDRLNRARQLRFADRAKKNGQEVTESVSPSSETETYVVDDRESLSSESLQSSNVVPAWIDRWAQEQVNSVQGNLAKSQQVQRSTFDNETAKYLSETAQAMNQLVFNIRNGDDEAKQAVSTAAVTTRENRAFALRRNHSREGSMQSPRRVVNSSSTQSTPRTRLSRYPPVQQSTSKFLSINASPKHSNGSNSNANGRCTSSLTSRDSQFMAWKRRQSYKPSISSTKPSVTAKRNSSLGPRAESIDHQRLTVTSPESRLSSNPTTSSSDTQRPNIHFRINSPYDRRGQLNDSGVHVSENDDGDSDSFCGIPRRLIRESGPTSLNECLMGRVSFADNFTTHCRGDSVIDDLDHMAMSALLDLAGQIHLQTMCILNAQERSGLKVATSSASPSVRKVSAQSTATSSSTTTDETANRRTNDPLLSSMLPDQSHCRGMSVSNKLAATLKMLKSSQSNLDDIQRRLHW